MIPRASIKLAILITFAVASAVSAFNSGDRVQCNSTNVNVRSCASTSCSSNGQVSSPTKGTVQSGPYSGSGFTWYVVNWDTGINGYTVQDYYQLLTAPAPSVSGVSPSSVVGSNNAQTFTVSGSNFVSGAKVQAAYSSNGYVWQDTTTNATFVNSGTLTVPINTQTTPDTWRVRVRNPDGQTSSNYATFTVTAQPSNPPSVTGVSPTTVVGSNSAQTFTVSGSNFVSGAKVQAAYSSNGYVWQDTTTNATFVNSGTLTVPINTQTTPDTWRVRVRNPDGQTSSNYATFTVTAQPSNPPSVTGVSPSSVVGSNNAQTFTVSGSNFVSGAKVQAAYSSNGYVWQDTTTNATFVNSGTLTGADQYPNDTGYVAGASQKSRRPNQLELRDLHGDSAAEQSTECDGGEPDVGGRIKLGPDLYGHGNELCFGCEGTGSVFARRIYVELHHDERHVYQHGYADSSDYDARNTGHVASASG